MKSSRSPRKQTFEESHETIQPYKSLPTPPKCVKHEYERREDGFNNIFLQCKICGTLK